MGPAGFTEVARMREHARRLPLFMVILIVKIKITRVKQ